MELNEEFNRRIKEFHTEHRGCGIITFLRNNPEIGEYISNALKEEPWFQTERITFCCFARDIFEPVRCIGCGKVLDAKIAVKGIVKSCSRKCGRNNELAKERYRKTNLERYGNENPIKSKAVCERIKQTNLERYGVEYACQSESSKEKRKQTCRARYGCDYVMQSDEFKKKSKETMKQKYGGENTLSSPMLMEKVKETMKKRYRAEYAIQNEQIKETRRKNNLMKYGVEHTLQLDSVKEKSRNAWLEKYGVEHPMLNRDVVENTIQHNIETYGVRSTALLPEVKEKQKQTNLEKYGSTCALCNEEIKKKSITTLQEHYGVDNVMQSEEIRQKASATKLSNSFDIVMERWKPFVIPLFDKSEYQGFDKPFVYNWKCSKCGNEFKQRIYVTGLGDDRYVPRCPNCFPKKKSIKEQKVLNFVKSIYDGTIIENDRNIISPQELDIYLPEKHLAIEFDGLYWHSEENGKDESYHLDKTNACADKGIRLVHIFEDEWNEKREIVKDRIRSILGINQTRIFARKCDVSDIDSKTANEFLDKNHLQGGDNSSIRYGLYHGDELVAVMTFGKPRFNKNHDWELIRFASKCGVNVVGGASKLLACFRKNHSGSIVSYEDRRYSDGRLYEKLGFMNAGVSNPNYWYVKGGEKLTRYACQKHRLKDVLGDGFDKNLSEFENMSLNGWTRVHDCGNIVFVKS